MARTLIAVFLLCFFVVLCSSAPPGHPGRHRPKLTKPLKPQPVPTTTPTQKTEKAVDPALPNADATSPDTPKCPDEGKTTGKIVTKEKERTPRENPTGAQPLPGGVPELTTVGEPVPGDSTTASDKDAVPPAVPPPSASNSTAVPKHNSTENVNPVPAPVNKTVTSAPAIIKPVKKEPTVNPSAEVEDTSAAAPEVPPNPASGAPEKPPVQPASDAPAKQPAEPVTTAAQEPPAEPTTGAEEPTTVPDEPVPPKQPIIQTTIPTTKATTKAPTTTKTPTSKPTTAKPTTQLPTTTPTTKPATQPPPQPTTTKAPKPTTQPPPPPTKAPEPTTQPPPPPTKAPKKTTQPPPPPTKARTPTTKRKELTQKPTSKPEPRKQVSDTPSEQQTKDPALKVPTDSWDKLKHMGMNTGFASKVLLPVALGVLVAVLIVCIVKGVRSCSKKNRRGRRSQLDELTSMDQVQLLADSSEDEF